MFPGGNGRATSLTPLSRLRRDGKAEVNTQARRPAGSIKVIQSFRVKGKECKSLRAFIFSLFYLPEAVTKKLFRNEKENFCCGCCYYFQQARTGTT
jgi:hypothetical protein